MSAADAKVLNVGPLPEAERKWTKLVKIDYKDPNGVARTWESAERTTRPVGSDIDGVGIVAILEKPTGPEIILQKQFRPPLDKVTIEVPAGLIDAGETAEEAAVRELREETGYVAKASVTSPLAKLWEECKRLEAEGCAIDARVGTLAEGIELAKTFKL